MLTRAGRCRTLVMEVMIKFRLVGWVVIIIIIIHRYVMLTITAAGVGRNELHCAAGQVSALKHSSVDGTCTAYVGQHGHSQ